MKLIDNVRLLTMLKNFCTFMRVAWPAVVLIATSALILIFLGFVGDVALQYWRSELVKEFGIRTLPPLSQWLAGNYGMNESDLLGTHFCFFWIFCIVFVASTYAPQRRFRRSFLSGFLLVWFFILVFWSFLMACAALPFVSTLSALPRPPAIMPTLNTIFLYALPALLVLLMVLRVAKGQRTRPSSSTKN